MTLLPDFACLEVLVKASASCLRISRGVLPRLLENQWGFYDLTSGFRLFGISRQGLGFLPPNLARRPAAPSEKPKVVL